ncbi:MAG: 50S ribosomal protein L21 [Candidatus Kapabacteria bacterium]|nr:50S ribosomal protein L21 [Candidatus Kapabacteria bacterium]
MFAVVEIAGMQFEVEPKEVLNVPRLAGEPGDGVSFNNILLVDDNGILKTGTPYIEGSISAKILEHGKDETVLVFHKKRRKGHRKLNGHRQKYTRIEIGEFSL